MSVEEVAGALEGGEPVWAVEWGGGAHSGATEGKQRLPREALPGWAEPMRHPSRRHWGFTGNSLPPAAWKEHCTTGQKEEWAGGWADMGETGDGRVTGDV